MKDFILSLVMPLRIKKYRFMTVFIAMFIFVVAVYFIALPNKVYINTHKDEYLTQKVYVNAYIDLPEDQLPANFIANNYKMNDKNEMTTTGNPKEFHKYLFENIDVKLYEEEMKSINLHIVFDLENSVDKILRDIREKYLKIYTEDSDERVTYSTYLTYVEWIKLPTDQQTETWLNNKFTELKALDDETIKTNMTQLTNFDLFNINVNPTENNYMIMFFKDYTVSQIAYYDEDKKIITYPSMQINYASQKVQFDFTTHKTLKEFGNYYVEQLFEPLSSSDQTSYLLQVVGYVIAFPAIFVLLLSWAMKKHGVMKTYKEYYNVAAISSIVPTLITCILGFFVPQIAPVYGALFCLFTLFTFIKINSTPELGD